MIYNYFAKYYDELFDEQMYLSWEEYVLKNVEPQTTVLDLAGGAGRLGVLLAKDGFKVTDVDLSEAMLSLASEHATDENVELQLVQGNMMDLKMVGQYDVVTCFADSLCYLKDMDEVVKTFQQVYQHLNEHGVFLFDMITPYQTDKVYPGYMYNYEGPNEERYFVWSSYANDEVKHGVIHDLNFFVQTHGGQYEKYSETHFERSYELSLIKKNLNNSGFEIEEVSGNFGKNKIDPQTTRWFLNVERVIKCVQLV